MRISITSKLKDPVVLSSLVGAVSFGVGAGIGYLIGKQNKQFVHAVPAEEWSLADLEVVPDLAEIEEVEVIAEGKAFVESILEAEEDTETGEEVEEDEVPKAIRQSIFDETAEPDEWDYEAEADKRNPTAPYILHKDEFFTDERSYTQSQLTYYAGDDILCDEENKPIYNHSTIIGPLNFGHGSGDQNVFYVRNDKLKSEYEVIKDQGLYSVEVLGIEIEDNARTADLQHSGNRRFREE